MKKKAQVAYAKVKVMTQSGRRVADPGDLEVTSKYFSCLFDSGFDYFIYIQDIIFPIV